MENSTITINLFSKNIIVLDPTAKNIYAVVENHTEFELNDVCSRIYQAHNENDIYESVLNDLLDGEEDDEDAARVLAWGRKNVYVDITHIGMVS